MSLKAIKKGAGAFLISIVVIFSFGAAGEICGSFFDTTAAAFGSAFPDNNPDDFKNVVSNLRIADSALENSMGTPVAVMVTNEKPRSLIAWDLKNGRQIWKVTHPINSEITVAGNLVIFQSGVAEVKALSLQDGSIKWTVEIEEGWDYHGADVNKNVAVVSIGVGGEEAGGYANGRLIAVDASSGSRMWQNNSGGGLIGIPAVQGNYVFAPWDRQKMVIIDTLSGEEVARLRADDFTINYISASSSGIYYGVAGNDSSVTKLFRFDENSATGSLEGSTVFAPSLAPVPSDPGFARDAFAKAVAGRSATEKIRFHWRPTVGSSPISMSDNLFYLHYWRFVIAFDATTSQVAWTYSSDFDIESVKAVSGGMIGINSDGHLFFLEAASGAEVWGADTGTKVLTAAFDADGFVPGAGGTREDILIGLMSIISDKDNRMLPIRSYAALLMAASPVPEVTRDLLQVYSDATAPKGLRDAVVEALKTRTSGSQYLVEALNWRYDFLEKTQAPPMSVVSPALVNMDEKSAVPGLLQHLMNHETRVEDLQPIAAAIRDLGDSTTTTTLQHFITLYHADSSMTGHEDAMTTAAEAMLKFNDAQFRGLVTDWSNDSYTLPELKIQLAELLNPAAVAKAREDAAVKAAADAQAQTDAQAQAELDAAAQRLASLPRTLRREVISGTVENNKMVLAPCVQSALGHTPTLQSIRIRFTITGKTGKTSGVRVLPNNIPGLKECIDRGLSEVTFPMFKSLRQSASYNIKVAGTRQLRTKDQEDLDSFGSQAPAPMPQPTPQYQQPKPQKPAPQQPAPQQPGYDPDAF